MENNIENNMNNNNTEEKNYYDDPNYYQEYCYDDDDNNLDIRPPDKPITERLVDYGNNINLSIDEELKILRDLNKSKGETRKNMKKTLTDNKIMESIEKNIIYHNDIDNNDLINNQYTYIDDDEFKRILKQSEEEYLDNDFNNQLMLINEQERKNELLKNKIMEEKINKLSNLIKKITNIVKLNQIITNDNIILSILEKYTQNYDEQIILNETEYNIFQNYLKNNYEKLFLLNRKTFLTYDEYEFLKARIFTTFNI